MKKTFKYYLGSWAVLLFLFNIISWVSPGWSGEEKYTSSFFIGYMFITLAFIGQLLVAYIALNKKDAKTTFYNLPLVSLSYAGLIMSFVFGGLCMIISPLPYWVGILVTAIILAAYAIAVMKAGAAAEIVESVDEIIKVQTLFIKSLRVDAETLVASAPTDEIKSELQKLTDAIRYSDPMSSSALANEESALTLKFAELKTATEKNNLEEVKSKANEFSTLLNARNRKCQMLK